VNPAARRRAAADVSAETSKAGERRRQSMTGQKGMILRSAHRPGLLNAQGMHFAMLHGDVTIRVLVNRVALQGGGPTLEEPALLARFETYRDGYEIVARQKFENGDFNGSMAITLDDLVNFINDMRQTPHEALAA
jgi:hypothetical protein